MTDRIKEQLSAFLDGELPDPESALLLKRLERDDELRGALSRYSLIGAVLRSDGDVPAARQVAARVSAAIAREPARGARRLRLPRREASCAPPRASRSPRASPSARCCWSSRSGRRTRLRPMRSWRGPNSRRCSRSPTTPDALDGPADIYVTPPAPDAPRGHPARGARQLPGRALRLCVAARAPQRRRRPHQRRRPVRSSEDVPPAETAEP